MAARSAASSVRDGRVRWFRGRWSDRCHGSHVGWLTGVGLRRGGSSRCRCACRRAGSTRTRPRSAALSRTSRPSSNRGRDFLQLKGGIDVLLALALVVPPSDRHRLVARHTAKQSKSRPEVERQVPSLGAGELHALFGASIDSSGGPGSRKPIGTGPIPSSGLPRIRLSAALGFRVAEGSPGTGCRRRWAGRASS